MQPSSCAICDSPLRLEIEKLDSQWNDIHTIQWARKQGLNISRFSLVKHRTNHLQPAVVGNNGNGGKSSDEKPDEIIILKPLELPARQAEIPSGIRFPKIKRKISTENIPSNGSSKPPAKPIDIKSVTTIPDSSEDSSLGKSEPLVEKASLAKSQIVITDQLLLDMVRDQVYHKLVNGEISLGLGDGFKAIEIKHKIAEESQNEKLLLEILNEIRTQELAT
jgi:hypothetical protein